MFRFQNSSITLLITIISTFLLLALCQTTTAAERFQRTIESYQIPDVELLNQHREKIHLKELLAQEKPVLVDFIYATCTTICPVLSAGFSNMQKRLGENAQDVRFISISIDPEHDQPEIMRDYLDRYRAKPGWDFLTGDRQDIDKVMHAFDAYVSNKMSHYPLMLMKTPEADQWVRIYGLIGTRELLKEYHRHYPATKEKP